MNNAKVRRNGQCYTDLIQSFRCTYLLKLNALTLLPSKRRLELTTTKQKLSYSTTEIRQTRNKWRKRCFAISPRLSASVWYTLYSACFYARPFKDPVRWTSLKGTLPRVSMCFVLESKGAFEYTQSAYLRVFFWKRKSDFSHRQRSRARSTGLTSPPNYEQKKHEFLKTASPVNVQRPEGCNLFQPVDSGARLGAFLLSFTTETPFPSNEG